MTTTATTSCRICGTATSYGDAYGAICSDTAAVIDHEHDPELLAEIAADSGPLTDCRQV